MTDRCSHTCYIGLVTALLCTVAIARWIAAAAFSTQFLPWTTGIAVSAVAVFSVATVGLFVASAGHLTGAILLGTALALATLPRWSVRVALYTWLWSLGFAFALAPLYLSWLLPPMTLNELLQDGCYEVPFAGARIRVPADDSRYWLKPVAAEEGLPTLPIRNVYADVDFGREASEARGQLELVGGHMTSVGPGFDMHHVDLVLRNGSLLIVLGEGSRIRDTTLRCSHVPCVIITPLCAVSEVSIHLPGAVAPQAIRAGDCFTSSAPPQEADSGGRVRAATGVVREGHEAVVCASVDFDGIARIPRIAAAARDGSLVLPPDVTAEVRATFAHTPVSRVVLEHAPVFFGFCSACMSWIASEAAPPVVHALHRTALWAAATFAPLVSQCKKVLWMGGTLLGCRVSSLDVLADYCDRADRFYQHDAWYQVMDGVLRVVVDLIADMEGVPFLAASIRWSWNAEVASGRLLWTFAGSAALNLHRLIAPIGQWAVVPVARWVWWMVSAAGSVVLWTFQQSSLGVDEGLAISGWIVAALCWVVHPAWATFRALATVAWSILRLYHQTGLATHLLLCLGQTGLLCVVLLREFRGRVADKRSGQHASKWSFFSTAASGPMALMSMLQHFSRPAVSYVLLHLVPVVLICGFHVLPFSSTLHMLTLQYALPGASVYGWLMFFVGKSELAGPSAHVVVFQIAPRFLGRALLSVAVQKTLGDLVFTILSEVVIGISIALGCFAAVVHIGKRKRTAPRPQPTS